MTSPFNHDEPTTLGGDGKWRPQINLRLSPSEKRVKRGIVLAMVLWGVVLAMLAAAFVGFMRRMVTWPF